MDETERAMIELASWREKLMRFFLEEEFISPGRYRDTKVSEIKNSRNGGQLCVRASVANISPGR